jgi:hypothetical protein
MAKTKMKRQVARRRKSGKKTRNRNKKRKNVIRGGLPLAKSVAILSYLFGEAKTKMPDSVQIYVGEREADAKVQFDYLNTLGNDGIHDLLKTPSDTDSYHELAGFDWQKFNWAKFISDNEKENASTIEAMEAAANKGDRLDKAVAATATATETETEL